MKYKSLLFLLFTLSYSTANAQHSEKLKSIVAPESPAFKLLDFNPSKILKPSSIKDLALNLSDFSKLNNSLTLPKLFAIEFSPTIFLDNDTKNENITTKQIENSYFNRIKFSFASRRQSETNPETKLALGLRYAKSNLENDKSSWNRNVSEFAIAVGLSSPDSLLKNAKYESIMFWGTYGKKIGDIGHWLIGISLGSKRDDKMLINSGIETFSASSRYYLGNNRAKALFELAYYSEHSIKKLLLNTGIELDVGQKIWLDINVGFVKDYELESNGEFVTKMGFKYGL